MYYTHSTLTLFYNYTPINYTTNYYKTSNSSFQPLDPLHSRLHPPSIYRTLYIVYMLYIVYYTQCLTLYYSKLHHLLFIQPLDPLYRCLHIPPNLACSMYLPRPQSRTPLLALFSPLPALWCVYYITPEGPCPTLFVVK